MGFALEAPVLITATALGAAATPGKDGKLCTRTTFFAGGGGDETATNDAAEEAGGLGHTLADMLPLAIRTTACGLKPVGDVAVGATTRASTRGRNASPTSQRRFRKGWLAAAVVRGPSGEP